MSLAIFADAPRSTRSPPRPGAPRLALQALLHPPARPPCAPSCPSRTPHPLSDTHSLRSSTCKPSPPPPPPPPFPFTTSPWCARATPQAARAPLPSLRGSSNNPKSVGARSHSAARSPASELPTTASDRAADKTGAGRLRPPSPPLAKGGGDRWGWGSLNWSGVLNWEYWVRSASDVTADITNFIAGSPRSRAACALPCTRGTLPAHAAAVLLC